MVKQGVRCLHGYVHIRFWGSETERFLNLCSANDMTLWNLRREAASQTAAMSIRDFKKLRPISRKTRTKVRIIQKHGLPFFFQKNRKRKAFFLGIFLFGLVIYLLSLHIWNIHVEGNVTYSTGTILQYLMEEEKIAHGIAKKKVNCSKLAADLRRQFPGFTWVSAKIQGTRLILEVKENHKSQTQKQREKKRDLIAPKDGTVVSIVTRSGVPLIKAGQSFQKGDVLVSGAVEIKNDAQEVTGYRYTAADADIYAKTTYPYYDEFSLTYQERKYTQESFSAIFFTAFSYRIDLGRSRPRDVRYRKQYDQVSKTSQIYLTENFLLPFTYGTVRTYPYDIIEKTYTKKEARAKANSRIYAFLKNLTQKGVEIYQKDVKIDTSETTCVTRGRIYGKEKIWKTAPVKKRSDNGKDSEI